MSWRLCWSRAAASRRWRRSSSHDLPRDGPPPPVDGRGRRRAADGAGQRRRACADRPDSDPRAGSRRACPHRIDAEVHRRGRREQHEGARERSRGRRRSPAVRTGYTSAETPLQRAPRGHCLGTRLLSADRYTARAKPRPLCEAGESTTCCSGRCIRLNRKLPATLLPRSTSCQLRVEPGVRCSR